MINKKILAASIAATFAFNANAAPIDLNTGSTALTYSQESIASSSDTIAANAAIDFKVNAGVNLALATNYAVRIKLTNATYAADATGVVATMAAHSGGTNTPIIDSAPVVGGGDVGNDFAVFNVLTGDTTGEQILSANEFTFVLGAASGLILDDAEESVTFEYSIYNIEDLTNALNGKGEPLASTSLTAIIVGSGVDASGSVTTVKNTALVAKGFKEFKASSTVAAGTTASMGRIELIATTGDDVVLAADSTDALAADVYTASAEATVTGDFSFGTWFMSAADTCLTTPSVGNTLVIDVAKTSATVPSLNYVTGQSLCVTVDGVAVVDRNSTGYTIETDENNDFTATVGSVVYDTTNITIPYLTSFSGYNQRVYILNNGTADAKYSTTFQTEDGTTATAGTAAIGTVPAKTLMVIKASDMVTFAGTTRGAAVIEIEAGSTNVEATTQTVTLADGSTDTVVLKVTGS